MVPLIAIKAELVQTPAQQVTMSVVRALLLLIALAVAAVAVQPLYRVDAEVLFLPQDGVALNAHTGRLLWRFPRFSGQTTTDGHGLLLISWVAAIEPILQQRVTRICRLRTSDGRHLWCHDWPGVQQWIADASGRWVYIHSPGHLQVLDATDGQADRGFGVRDDQELTLLPLPGQGALLLEQRHGHTEEALSYRPGAAVLTAEDAPPSLYPFRGDGHGVLLYAREKGEFFLAAPLRLLLGQHPRPSPEDFPRASLDGDGYVFTDWQGQAPVVRGGTYGGRLWQAPRRASDPELAVAGGTAVMLEREPEASQLRAWNLASGQPLYTETINGDPRQLSCADNTVVLQSNSEIRLLDAPTGTESWRVERHAGALAAVAQTAVVFWESDGYLIGLARNNGALLWRLRFESPGAHRF